VALAPERIATAQPKLGLQPRPYTIQEYTRTVCPLCAAEKPLRADEDGTFVDGMLVSHDDSMWIRRFCPKHGESESLYEEDANIWRARAGWSTPTLAITPDRADNYAGFPDGYRLGLPASHGQHTCILLLNVTEHCNYACPTCYASALAPGTPKTDDLPTIDQLLHTVDTVIERENGKLGVCMLSGGEPTLRKDLEEIIEAILERNVTRILLNTNGRRISKDDRFLSFLRKHRDKVEIYLQFDGFKESTHLALRGEDLREEKERTLERLQSAGVFHTLVMTVCKGVNDDEVGAVVKHGLGIPRCAGVAIQPMFGSGRTPVYDPRDRVTPTGVIRRLHDQSGGLLSDSDFIPLPCSHKDCCDITYLIRDRNDKWTSLPALVGRDELKTWIHLVSNTISFESASDGVKALVQSGALQRVFSEQQKVGAVQLAADMASMCNCIPGVSELLGGIWMKFAGRGIADKLAERTFRVTVKMFMDAHTLHESRIRQCCVHVGTFEDDPRRHSFCWRWMFEDATDFPAREGLKPLRQVSLG
jgi:7,8-dihydro-6-hydroxymethylpterin dimethyltransferase